MDETQVKYRLDKTGDFIIENYAQAKSFSSFFAGIAGLGGIPMWAFYVNRGQAIASFGTKDKDGAILEFFPANQAYQLTPIKGFRTFIKLKKGAKQIIYEPFRQNGCPLAKSATSLMKINPYQLQIQEYNRALNLNVNVSYITVPQEPYAALARLLTITNSSKKAISIEVIDGLAQIIPYGENEWHQKHMSRTIEAWIRVTNLNKKIPFYKLKVKPHDKPELEQIDKGNFYLAAELRARSSKQLNVIIDPDLVFGRDADISFPQAFASKNFCLPKAQRAEGKTPSAFSYAKLNLKPGAKAKIISLIGNVDTAEKINRLAIKIIHPEFFTQKLNQNKQIVDRLQNSIFTKSSKPEFDSYSKQTFLDNVLRGGFPYSIQTPSGPFVFYLYARKHGDLERDYNAFSLLPSYFSQGNGSYRDINQNRRNDVLLNPDVGEDNIRTFINAIQPDGFNPLLIDGVVLKVKQGTSYRKLLNEHFVKKSEKNKIDRFLRKGFAPGGLLLFLEQEAITPKQGGDGFLKKLLSISSKEDLMRYGEGFWIDHWTYNLDLIENYLSVYPDRIRELMLDRKFSFYDTYYKVLSRDQKYVYINGKIRQLGSVKKDKKKAKLISQRKSNADKVHTADGKGKVYKTTLLIKLLNLLINKSASFDPFGVGIEMEANKPAWCDSLNNMPGIFGSSVSETAELKRLILFVQCAMDTLGLSKDDKLDMPDEMSDFLKELKTAVSENLNSNSKSKDFTYWDRATSAKEIYRQRVWFGFSGKKKEVSVTVIYELLALLVKKIDAALKKSFCGRKTLPHTYFFHEVTRYKFIKAQGENKLNRKGLACVKALEFKSYPVSYFLEAPVHLMKVLKNIKQKKTLYDHVKKSQLYDKKLKMYKVNAPLKGMPADIGRSIVFTPGWLENESIWMHMEYKYLLELIRAGLYKEFFGDLNNALVAFMSADTYGRSILENSSFIVSSVHPEKSLHGRGFVARLSGSTTEFISIWLAMALGRGPFYVNQAKELNLKFSPVLPGWLFTKETSNGEFYFSENNKEEILIPKNSFAFSFLGKILVIYHNPKRANTYGKGAVAINKIILKPNEGKEVEIKGNVVPTQYAKDVREGKFKQIDLFLG